MLRRLFFFLPNKYCAESVANHLHEVNISKPHSHVVPLLDAQTVIPETRKNYKTVAVIRGQSILWNFNLLLFAVAMITFLITLVIGEWLWIALAFTITAITFYVGERLFVDVPVVPLTEITEASLHGEALLMVDVPGERIAEVKNFIRHHHPEAIVGSAN